MLFLPQQSGTKTRNIKGSEAGCETALLENSIVIFIQELDRCVCVYIYIFFSPNSSLEK
jgi:hypothetical protein